MKAVKKTRILRSEGGQQNLTKKGGSEKKKAVIKIKKGMEGFKNRHMFATLHY